MIHRQLWVPLIGIELACITLSVMGAFLLLNRFDYLFFNVIGAVFLGVGLLGGVSSARLFLKNSRIVKSGTFYPLSFLVQKKEWSDSTAYVIQVEQGDWKGEYSLLPGKGFAKVAENTVLAGGVFVNTQGEVAAFAFEQHLFWVY